MTTIKTRRKVNLSDKECRSVEWFTPEWVLEIVGKIFREITPDGPKSKYGIDVDPCTTLGNPTGALRAMDRQMDGLSRAWVYSDRGDSRVFVNPPYGREMYAWIGKACDEAERGRRIFMILAASSRWDQAGWQRLFSPELRAMWMPRGRVRFLDQWGAVGKSPNYPTLGFSFNIDADVVRRHAGDRGPVVTIGPER